MAKVESLGLSGSAPWGSYALDLAREGGVAAAGAEVARERLVQAVRRGYGRRYRLVLLHIVTGDE